MERAISKFLYFIFQRTFLVRYATHVGFMLDILADVELLQLLSKFRVCLHRGKWVELLGD